MKNKELILLIEELKQQVEECRDRDSSPYIDGLLRRTDFIINSLNVNNGVLDDVINCEGDCEYTRKATGVFQCPKCNKIVD